MDLKNNNMKVLKILLEKKKEKTILSFKSDF